MSIAHSLVINLRKDGIIMDNDITLYDLLEAVEDGNISSEDALNYIEESRSVDRYYQKELNAHNKARSRSQMANKLRDSKRQFHFMNKSLEHGYKRPSKDFPQVLDYALKYKPDRSKTSSTVSKNRLEFKRMFDTSPKKSKPSLSAYTTNLKK